MAEDVLRSAGFVEHVNYTKQTAVDGGRGVPDFTFQLPKGHVLYMDVKFPFASYLRYLEAESESDRTGHRDTFLRDVRLRIKELADRDYPGQSTCPSVDYTLLFLPNETINAFIHEQDPTIVDQALAQKIVICSPLTLFAFLGVIRQAFDNFVIERTSDEILQLLSTFGTQWTKFSSSLDTVQKRFDSLHKEFEHLNGPRRRQLERPLQQLESLRTERGLPMEGELFGAQIFELGA
jgi:DNA recombination protein RmuC